jgi:restriction system protein
VASRLLDQQLGDATQANHGVAWPATSFGMYRLLMAKVDPGSAVGDHDPAGDAPAGPPERIFARRMKRERLRRGWRQEDLADRLALASLDLHPSAIAKIEREPDLDKGIEPRMIRLNEAVAIARVLGRSVEQMISDDDLMDPENELNQLNEALTHARHQRDAATHAIMEVEERIADLTQRIQSAHDRARIRREEQQRARAEREEHVRSRISEAQFRTEVATARLAAIDTLLQRRRRDLTSDRDTLREIFTAKGAEAFAIALQTELTKSPYPEGLRPAIAAQYRPSDREMILECEFPSTDVIPVIAVYQYVQTKDEIQPTSIPQPERVALYRQLLAQIALRLLAEGFDLTAEPVVGRMTVNGRVAARDRATGRPIKPCLLSIRVTRDAFDEIVLDRVDPVECLGSYLNGMLSPNPLELEPIRALVELDTSQKAYTSESYDAPDGPTDLLAMTSVEFEHLTRQLFSSIGMESWVTSTTADSGVDAVVVHDDPVMGGLCVVQAKRYTRPVGLETVQALAGAIEDRRAAKGLLVTTSWVSRAGHDFAERNGRIQIIEAVQLKALLRKHLGVDARISLPRLPEHWKQDDLL